ncbi:MAG: hypothetical protein ACRDN9_08440 [Streptosporangiaceae bacterium]
MLEERPRRVGRRWLVAGAVGFVVLAGLFGILLGVLSRGGDADTVAAQEAASPRQQAVALDQLLSGSRDDRRAVVRAVVSLEHCRDLGASRTALRRAASSRETLVAKLGRLGVSKISGGARLKGTLHEAWQSSADADRAFARWGDQVARAGCPGGHPKKAAAFREGVRSSADASRAKKSFVARWNDVADRFGLKARSASQI